MIAIRDNSAAINEGYTERIPTTELIEEIGRALGFRLVELR